MKAASCDLDKAPTLVASMLPSSNIIKVGIPLTPYLVGVCGLSSILCLAITNLPSFPQLNFQE